MGLLIKLLAGTALALVYAMDICMLVRAILSWFPPNEDHPLGRFVTMVTEPIIYPFRVLFDRMGWFRNSPLDVPFFCGVLVLSLLGTLLPLIT